MFFDYVNDPGVFRVKPIINHTVRGLCVKPYPGHPKGCPNFGRCDRCPPQAPFFDEVFDLDRPVFAVINEFNFGDHVTKMLMLKKKNGKWRTEKEARCVLYWQGGARKQLEMKVSALLKEDCARGMVSTWCPEGMGVDVEACTLQGGIRLWPLTNIARQVALLAFPRM